jgi:hypothetical protein
VSEQAQAITNYCIKMLQTLSPYSDDFVGQVLQLGCSQAAALHQLRLQGTDTLIRGLGDTFVKILSYKDGVSTMQYIQIFESLYGVNGPLATDVFIDHYNALPSHSKLIAAMLYLSLAEPSVIGIGKRWVIKKQVSEIALQAGKNWKGLNTELQVIDGQRSEARVLDHIPHFLRNLQTLFTTEKDVVFIQQSGGVERLKEIGAGINSICLSMLNRIPTTSMGHVGLPLVHQFLKDANSELLASGVITKEVANERQSLMMQGVLNVRRSLKKEVNPCYHAMLVDLMPNLSKKHAPVLIPRLMNYLAVDEIKANVKDLVSLIEADLPSFKKALKSNVDSGMHHDLVIKLGVDCLFKPTEMQKLKGAKLESALGL